MDWMEQNKAPTHFLGGKVALLPLDTWEDFRKRMELLCPRFLLKPFFCSVLSSIFDGVWGNITETICFYHHISSYDIGGKNSRISPPVFGILHFCCWLACIPVRLV